MPTPYNMNPMGIADGGGGPEAYLAVTSGTFSYLGTVTGADDYEVFSSGAELSGGMAEGWGNALFARNGGRLVSGWAFGRGRMFVQYRGSAVSVSATDSGYIRIFPGGAATDAQVLGGTMTVMDSAVVLGGTVGGDADGLYPGVLTVSGYVSGIIVASGGTMTVTAGGVAVGTINAGGVVNS